MIKIYVDGGCDLPIGTKDISILPLTYRIDDIEYVIDNFLSDKEFYDKMRAGFLPKTASVNTFEALEALKKELTEGNEVIVITLSSLVSRCYNNICLAMNQLNSNNIRVTDSKTGTLAIGLLARKAKLLVDNGYDINFIVNYIEKNKLFYHLCVSVDDLVYAVKGGRVASTKGLACKALNLKPNIIVNKDGNTISDSVIRGTNKVYKEYSKQLYDNIDDDSVIGIMHADNYDKAMKLKESIENLKLDREILISNINPIIGTYAGPNAIGIAYKTKSLKLRDK